MREDIERTKANVRRTLDRRRVAKEEERSVTGGKDEETGIFGTMPPAPHREIVQGKVITVVHGMENNASVLLGNPHRWAERKA